MLNGHEKKQYDTPLAERLDTISQQHHLSGSDLARIAGVGRSSVNAWKKEGQSVKIPQPKLQKRQMFPFPGY
ncbi:hypothetical protein SE963_27975 [Escherichia coli]|nr:hypothetical protein [Escherichia coli]